MPVILDFLRPYPYQIRTKEQIREFAEPIVLKNFTPREQAFGWALTYLVRGKYIERPRRGSYRILPKGLDPFTQKDGEDLTDENED